MPAPGCRDLPGTKAGQRRATREADKEAGGKRKQEGTGRSQGLRSGKGRGGAGHVLGVTWSRSHVDRAARAPPGPEFCAPAQSRARGGAPVQ